MTNPRRAQEHACRVPPQFPALLASACQQLRLLHLARPQELTPRPQPPDRLPQTMLTACARPPARVRTFGVLAASGCSTRELHAAAVTCRRRPSAGAALPQAAPAGARPASRRTTFHAHPAAARRAPAAASSGRALVRGGGKAAGPLPRCCAHARRCLLQLPPMLGPPPVLQVRCAASGPSVPFPDELDGALFCAADVLQLAEVGSACNATDRLRDPCLVAAVLAALCCLMVQQSGGSAWRAAEWQGLQ